MSATQRGMTLWVVTVLFVSSGVGGSLGIGMGVTAAIGNQPVDDRRSQPAADEVVIYVDGDQQETFSSIQPAVTNAPEGATIRVGPGVYTEQLRVNKTITLVGSANTTVTSPTDDADTEQQRITTAIRIPSGSAASPRIQRLNLSGFGSGIVADDTEGDWSVLNVKITESRTGISAVNTSGKWDVRETQVSQADHGLYVSDTSERWTVDGSTFTQNEQAITVIDTQTEWTITDSQFTQNTGSGVVVSTDSDWSLSRSHFQDNDFAGVTVNGDGNWTVQNTTFTENTHAVRASYTSGSWEIQHAEFTENEHGVTANRTRGLWQIHYSAFESAPAVVASEASLEGNASHNWWGEPGEPSEQDCRGNVTCADPVGPDRAGTGG